MRLDPEIHQLGFFWLPGTDRKLPGNLHITSHSEIELHVMGSFFGDPIAHVFGNERTIRRIVGCLETDKYVTLENCFITNSNFRLFSGTGTLTIHASAALLGATYNDGERVTAAAFDFSVDGLETWLGISGIKVDPDFVKQSAVINVSKPESIDVELSDISRVSFTFRSSLPTMGPLQLSLSIAQTASVTLRSSSEQPLEHYLSMMRRMSNFISLAVDKPVGVTSVRLYSENSIETLPSGKIVQVPIEYIATLSLTPELPPKIEFHNMLFNFQRIENRLQSVLQQWMAHFETMAPAFNLYFGARAGANKFIDSRFLTLAQGIESLHRRTSDEQEMDDSEFRELMNTLSDACPPQWRNFVSQRLRYMNELSFRKRLKAMIHPFTLLFGGEKAAKAFIEKVVDVRNYLTHYEPRHWDGQFTGEEYMHLAFKLEALFQLHILKLLDFSTDEILEIAQENQSLRSKLGLAQ